MAKNTNKTTETAASVSDFINTIADETKRADSFKLTALMEKASGHKAKMWGPAIVGFGSYHYKYESGHEGDACRIGFSPRKANIALYLPAVVKSQGELLSKLGKHKVGGGCIYIISLQV